MMLFLVLNVGDGFFLPRETNAKGAIAFLPRERAQCWESFVNPFGRVTLQKLQRLTRAAWWLVS